MNKKERERMGELVDVMLTLADLVDHLPDTRAARSIRDLVNVALGILGPLAGVDHV